MIPVPEWLATYEAQQLQTEPVRISKESLLESLKTQPDSVTIVDLRNEQERGSITQAVHIPATVVGGPSEIKEKFIEPILGAKPTTERIVIHCNLSGKRASFIGGWAQDYVEANGPSNVKVEILHEGIVGWLNGDQQFKEETTTEN